MRPEARNSGSQNDTLSGPMKLFLRSGCVLQDDTARIPLTLLRGQTADVRKLIASGGILFARVAFGPSFPRSKALLVVDRMRGSLVTVCSAIFRSRASTNLQGPTCKAPMCSASLGDRAVPQLTSCTTIEEKPESMDGQQNRDPSSIRGQNTSYYLPPFIHAVRSVRICAVTGCPASSYNTASSLGLTPSLIVAC